MKIRITYPQITFESKELEITEEQYEEVINSGDHGRADFIWNQLGEGDQDWMPHGKKGLLSAVETDYASIKKNVNP